MMPFCTRLPCERSRHPAHVLPRGAAQGGFTVLEAVVAGFIVSVLLSGLFVLNSDMMHLLASSTEAANASAHLQTRVEQVRLANWSQLSDPTWVQGTLLQNSTDADLNLPGYSETLTVSPFLSPSSPPPTVAPPPPFTVTRAASGTVTTSPPGYSFSTLLSNQEMLQIDLSVTWPALGRTRSRTQSTVISPWGISK